MTERQCFELKLSNTISKLDPSVQPVFKALANLSDELQEISDMHDQESRKVEEEFETQFRPIYELRQKIIEGESVDVDISQFDT